MFSRMATPSRSLSLKRVLLAAAASLALFGGAGVEAAPTYVFVKIADETSGLSGFRFPTVDLGSSNVIFVASDAVQNGVYFGNGGALETVATGADGLDSFGDRPMRDQPVSVFVGGPSFSKDVWARLAPFPPIIRADPEGDVRSLDIDRAGGIVFSVNEAGGGANDRIEYLRGSFRYRIGGEALPPSWRGTLGFPRMTDGESIVYPSDLTLYRPGLPWNPPVVIFHRADILIARTDASEPPVSVARACVSCPHSRFGPQLAVNASRRVAFQGRLSSEDRWRIVAGTGRTSVEIASAPAIPGLFDGTTSPFRGIEITDAGVVLFEWVHDVLGAPVIAAGPDFEGADRVIGPGDALDGRTISGLSLGGAKGSGSFAFTVRFAGGGEAVYRADPVATLIVVPVPVFLASASEPLVLDASASKYSKNDPIVLYEWDLDGDGEFDWADTAPVSKLLPAFHQQFLREGENAIQVRIRSASGDHSLGETTATLPTACSDGIDNDQDGGVDSPKDEGCRSSLDLSEEPDCGDGLDNDGDGLGDWPHDRGCASAKGSFEDPACDNDVDDDGDLVLDFSRSRRSPRDPGCVAAWSDLENPACNNGLDDDGDGKIDLHDPGCLGRASRNSEEFFVSKLSGK